MLNTYLPYFLWSGIRTARAALLTWPSGPLRTPVLLSCPPPVCSPPVFNFFTLTKSVNGLALITTKLTKVQVQTMCPQEQPLSADTLGWGSPADMAGGVIPTSSFAPQPESARQIPGLDPTPPQPAPQPVRVDALPAAASSPTGWVESMDAKAALGFRLGFGSGFGFGFGWLG